MSHLEAILGNTRMSLPALAAQRAELERRALAHAPAPAFVTALQLTTVALIAEVKRRSPSAGRINDDLDPVTLARAYVAGGAAAISVLTDATFFGGSVADLADVAGAIDRPVLRKDFILDATQLLEARAGGAAAALLIVRALEPSELSRLIRFSLEIGLTPLVEVHSAGEIAQALDAGATVVGINARDLDTLAVDVDAAWRLLPLIPPGCVAVAESGMATAADVARAAEAGADAVLVGSALARTREPASLAKELSGVRRRGR